VSADRNAGARVTVVVPCYNYGRFLDQCVSSILAQTDVDPDVVIVDDASPDGSVEVAQALARADPRIRVVAHARNQGHIATYNDGLAHVTGDYVALVSADDLLAPGSLGRATQCMERHPEVGLVYGATQIFSGDEPPAAPKPTSAATGTRIWPGRRWIELRCRRLVNPIWSAEVVLRASVQRAIGGYAADQPHSADFDMWLRAAAVSDVAFVRGGIQALRRVHGGNMSHTSQAGMVIDLRARRTTFDSFLARPSADPAQRGLVRRRLALEALDRALLDARHEPEVAKQLLAFARETDPSVQELRRARAVSVAAEHGAPGWGGHASYAALRGRRAVTGRLAAYRLDRTGV
jgi:glycosyltransferase involved in cell wall biosynthesis